MESWPRKLYERREMCDRLLARVHNEVAQSLAKGQNDAYAI